MLDQNQLDGLRTLYTLDTRVDDKKSELTGEASTRIFHRAGHQHQRIISSPAEPPWEPPWCFRRRSELSGQTETTGLHFCLRVMPSPGWRR